MSVDNRRQESGKNYPRVSENERKKKKSRIYKISVYRDDMPREWCNLSFFINCIKMKRSNLGHVSFCPWRRDTRRMVVIILVLKRSIKIRNQGSIRFVLVQNRIKGWASHPVLHKRKWKRKNEGHIRFLSIEMKSQEHAVNYLYILIQWNGSDKSRTC